MNIMNFDRALNILGLSRNYTEDDLKKAYRKLMAKYHPDLYENKGEKEKKFAEEKAKDINAAKEYLEKCLKDRGNNFKKATTNSCNTRENTGSDADAFEVYIRLMKKKAEFKKKFYSFFVNDVNSVCDNPEELLVAVRNKFSKLHTRYIIKFNNVKTIFELYVLDASFNSDVIDILSAYAKEYCKKYNITVDINTLESTSLKILQEQLEELRKKTQTDGTIVKLLEELFHKYEFYAGFSVIENLILDIKSKIENEYKEGKLTIEEVALKFDKSVSEEFKDYYKRLEFLNKMKKSFELGNYPRFYNMLIPELEKNISNPGYFWSKAYSFYEAFDKIKDTPSSYYDYDIKDINKKNYNDNFIYKKKRDIK